MDLQAVLSEVRSWPAEERLRLIEEMWDGLSDEATSPDLEEDLKELLDRRIEAADENPGAVTPWEVVEARALARYRR